jgi:hypothetical protein
LISEGRAYIAVGIVLLFMTVVGNWYARAEYFRGMREGLCCTSYEFLHDEEGGLLAFNRQTLQLAKECGKQWTSCLENENLGEI